MRLPNGYGGVVKLSGNRRRPYAARITTGWHINDITGKRIQHARVGFSRFDSGWLCRFWHVTTIIPSMGKR